MTMMTTTRLSIGLFIVFFSPLLEAAAQDAKADDEARIDRVLTELQSRSDGLHDIRCEVAFTDDDRVNLAKNTKKGRIRLLIADPNPLFLVHFDKTELDGVAGKQEWYLFDGQWFYQAVERLQQVTKQQFAGTGQKLDLFDIEKAPFPLPFGQKKETILKNFDVRLAQPTGSDPPDTDHLICNPKPESRLAKKYDQLDLFVDRKLHLPTRIVVTKNNGLEINTASFPDLTDKSVNTGIKPKDFEKPAIWNKYKEVVEESVPANE